MSQAEPLVRYLDQTAAIPCPHGDVHRIVTGGDGGVANVHRVRVSKGQPHCHAGYHEVYYVLGGTGTLTIGGRIHPLRPGAVAVIPAGTVHALEASGGDPLDFVIFGTPPMPIDDARARPLKANTSTRV